MATPRPPPRLFKYKGNHRPKYATLPQNVYFKPIMPLELRDQVTGRDSSTKKTPCVGQMIEMLDCLKRTGFSDGPCNQVISAFKQCNEEYKQMEKVKQERAEDDISTIKNSRELKREQLNELLKSFGKKR